MRLTDVRVRQLKPLGVANGEKYADERGLHLHVTATGKYWRLSYRFAGKQKTLALGVYPDVTLIKARARRDEARNDPAGGLGAKLAARPADGLGADGALRLLCSVQARPLWVGQLRR